MPIFLQPFWHKIKAQTPKVGFFFQLFAKNCMKMKEFGSWRGGGQCKGINFYKLFLI